MSITSKPSAMNGNALDHKNIGTPGNTLTVYAEKAKAISGLAKRHVDDVDSDQRHQNDVSVVPLDSAVDVAEFHDGMMLAQAEIGAIGDGVAVASGGGAAIVAAEAASESLTAKTIGGAAAVIGGIAAAGGGGGGGGPVPTITSVGKKPVETAAAAQAAANAAVTRDQAQASADQTDAVALTAAAHQADTAAVSAANNAESLIAHATEATVLAAAASTAAGIAAEIAGVIHAAPLSATPLADAAAVFAATHHGDAAAAAAAAIVFDQIAAVPLPAATDVAAAADIVAGALGATALGMAAGRDAAVQDATVAHDAAVVAQQNALEAAHAAAAAVAADAAAAAAAAHAADAAAALATVVTVADLTDTAELAAASIAAHHSPITVAGFDAGPLASGGDIIDMSAIASLTDSVATGLTLHSPHFGANNVFIFDGTPVSIDDAASAIAADNSVAATQGYIVIRDSGNADAVTVYHSADLHGHGADTALVILSRVNIADLTAANFVV